MTRRTRPSLQLSLALTVLILLAVLAGCGYKDKPVPPSQIVPKAVTDLQYQLDEKGVTLYWSYPRETVTGDKLIDMMFRTANGRLTAAEALGHREFVLTRLYESA